MWLLFAATLPLLRCCRGFNVQIMVTTKLSSLDRRAILRNMFNHCMQRVGAAHTVEMLFFLGNTSDAPEELMRSLDNEEAENKDLVFVVDPILTPGCRGTPLTFLSVQLLVATDWPMAQHGWQQTNQSLIM